MLGTTITGGLEINVINTIPGTERTGITGTDSITEALVCALIKSVCLFAKTHCHTDGQPEDDQEHD